MMKAVYIINDLLAEHLIARDIPIGKLLLHKGRDSWRLAIAVNVNAHSVSQPYFQLPLAVVPANVKPSQRETQLTRNSVSAKNITARA
ncbi:MAG: hypothetical protein M3Y22_01275 [Pseudomonadota bacterium]|nr:hypothetical protein [Pseudomonadota bacterium]